MKKVFLMYCFLFLALNFISESHAAGGITHMFLAEEAINQLSDVKLKNLLRDNLDAYLVGAIYPDSGYIKGTSYGEDSHWDPFIYAFADYLKNKYQQSDVENPRLVAFLFGCASHRVSDEVTHRIFYNVMKNKDFHGDWNKAHAYGDEGIDLLLTWDKNQWIQLPTHWWIPVRDLVAVYHQMQKDEYTASQIMWGNSVLSLAEYSERLLVAPAYPWLQLKMPWTAHHYYDWPQGGMIMDEGKIADYQNKLWSYLHDKSHVTPKLQADHRQPTSSFSHQFATIALEKRMATVSFQANSDGSIELAEPIIQQPIQFHSLMIYLKSHFLKT